MKTLISRFVFSAFVSAVAGLSTAAYAELNCAVDSPTSTMQSPYKSGSPFQTAIGNLRMLQFPVSTTTCLTLAQMKNQRVIRNHWFMNTSNHMVFRFNGEKSNRLELRGESYSGNATNKELRGSYLLPNTSPADGFTIAQSFSESLNTPILRLEVIKERSADGKVYKNHLFAVWNPINQSSRFVSLGPAAAGGKWGDIRIRYGNNGKVDVWHTSNGVTLSSSQSINGYNASNQKSYFKIGCYLQRDGNCFVNYRSMRIDR